MKLQLLIAPTLFAFALPLQAETAAQVLEYKSAFEGYKSYSDSEIQNWPKSNQLVDEIGGWRVYAREPAEAKQETKVEGMSTGSTEQQPAPRPHQHGGAQ